MAEYVLRTEGVYVSHHYVAKLWRDNGLKPHRQGTFKVSRDPAFAEKVADVVGLYLDPPGGAVVLSIDEKTQIQALDRTQPVLPITFGVTEKRTADYVRHGTTNLFAALNVGTGEVFGRLRPDPRRRRVPGVPQEGGQAARGQGDPCRAGQPVHAHHRRGQGMAGEEPERHLPFHPGRLVVAEPGRNLVRDHHPPVDPPRHVQLRQGSDQADPRLHRPLEHQRRNHSSGPPPPTRSSPRFVSSRPASRSSSTTTPSKATESRDTSRRADR